MVALLTAGKEREVFRPVAKWRRSYLVTDRYIPRKDKNEVLTFLQDKDGRDCHAVVDEALYDEFEVGDVIRFPRSNPRQPNAEGWLVVQPPFDVVRAVMPLERLSIRVAYISKPVRICETVYFVTAIGPQKWLKIPYDLAQSYFEKGQVGGSGKDFYQVLGVSRDAELSDIRAAYRLLVRQYHHDAGQRPDDQTMRRINEAYDVLSDPEERAKYDRMIMGNGPSLMGWPGSGAGELEILGEDRGSLICALEILSFKRDQRFDQVTFFAGELFDLSKPHASVAAHHTSIRFGWRYEGEKYTFDVSNTLPNVRYAFSGTFDVQIEYRKRAHWNPDNGDYRYTWDVRDLTILGHSAQ